MACELSPFLRDFQKTLTLQKRGLSVLMSNAFSPAVSKAQASPSMPFRSTIKISHKILSSRVMF